MRDMENLLDVTGIMKEKLREHGLGVTVGINRRETEG